MKTPIGSPVASEVPAAPRWGPYGGGGAFEGTLGAIEVAGPADSPTWYPDVPGHFSVTDLSDIENIWPIYLVELPNLKMVILQFAM